MSARSEREVARETVVAYHQAQLAVLVERVGAAIDAFRTGELSAFEVDRALFQYSRAANELWKFCNGGDLDSAANLIREGARVDWWERGAPRPR